MYWLSIRHSYGYVWAVTHQCIFEPLVFHICNNKRLHLRSRWTKTAISHIHSRHAPCVHFIDHLLGTIRTAPESYRGKRGGRLHLYVLQIITAENIYWIAALLVIFNASYAIAWTPLVTSYPIEVLPFSLRAKGYTICIFFVSAAVVFNQYINPIALAAIGWKYYIVYCAWIAFELVFVYFFIVETKGRTLEETALYVTQLLSAYESLTPPLRLFDGPEQISAMSEVDKVITIDASGSSLKDSDSSREKEKATELHVEELAN